MRKVEIIAIKDGTIEQNLRQLGYSSSLCLRLRKRMGLIEVQGVPRKIVDSVKKDEIFSIYLEDSKKREIIPYSGVDVRFIYEDEDIAVIDKPSGLAVINTREHYGKSLENVLAAKWGEFTYRPVNRLDKDTSGLMIIAKNQLAHSILGKNHIKRKYLALCEGVFKEEGEVNAPIGRKEGSIMERCITPLGKNAITKYKIIENYSTYTLVELELLTGRTHQIRVHMASIGHALLGDSLYNLNYEKDKILDNGYILNRQALHSSFLEFRHPITKELLEFSSKPEFL